MPAPTARRAMGPQRRALLCAFVALLLVYAGYAVWRASAWRGGGRRPVKNAHAEQAHAPSVAPVQVPDDRRSGLPVRGEVLAPVPTLPHSTKAPADAPVPRAPSPPTVTSVVKNADNFVAVCAATRSRSAWTTLAASDPVRILLPSLARTTTAADNVRVFLGANADDAFWGQERAQELARHARTAWALDVALRQYAHAPNHIPFNALMRDAFDAGAEFLVRVNDDTEFVTPGWVRLGVDALAAFEPPNVGVVGPVCHEGNTKILTHDMVHRTHLTIFDTYYPPEFSNWFVDDWISRVYGAARTRRHEGWVVKHRLTPRRYTPEERERAQLEVLVEVGVQRVAHYIKKAKSHSVKESNAAKMMSDTCATPMKYLQTIFESETHIPANSSCIITGFDKTHEDEGMLMLLQMLDACYKTRLLVYDMGMTKHALDVISVNEIIEIYTPPVIMPTFAKQFERGSTAFKPIVITDAIMTKGCIAGLWGDASTRHKKLCVSGNLPRLALSLHRFPDFPNPNQEWTHPNMYDYFQTLREDDTGLQFEANNILFDMQTSFWPSVLCRWLYCALQKSCILPDGAFIKQRKDVKINGIMYRAHRDDQSALNLAITDTLTNTKIQYNSPVLTLNALINVHRGEKINNVQRMDLVQLLKRRSKVEASLFQLKNNALTSSSQTIITNKQYIQLCDVTFKCRSSHNFRLPVKNGAIICVRGDESILQEFFSLNLQTSFTLVTIESDQAVPQQEKWLHNKNLIAWYGWNSVHASVIPIPIGLDGNIQSTSMHSVSRTLVKKSKLLLAFRLNRDERKELHARAKRLDFVEVQPYVDIREDATKLRLYYELMSTYKWVLCPRGMGEDTHRVWEALYMGAIPVVLKSSISDIYAGLPVIQLDSWSDLSLAKLHELEPQHPLDIKNAYFEHWSEIIRGKISTLTQKQMLKRHKIHILMSFEQVRQHNHATRNSVQNWIERNDWESPPSLFHYGLPSSVYHLINKDVGAVPIQHDLISFLGKIIEEEVGASNFRYLEMGVAVGKSLYTQMNIFDTGSSIVALDIEDINPTLAKMLELHETVTSWTDEHLLSMVKTTRRTDVARKYGHDIDSIKKFGLRKNSGPTLTYVAGDEFSVESWMNLRNLSTNAFHLILSDALHTQEALLVEWKMIQDKKLLDKHIFAYVWDDCNSGDLRNAFKQIVDMFHRQNIKRFFCSAVFNIHGWLGVHEGKHPTCVMTSLDLQTISRIDPLFSTVEVLESIKCFEPGNDFLHHSGDGNMEPRTNERRTVVMAAAIGYKLRDFQKFLLPLRKVYMGAIVLFGDVDAEAVELCKSLSVENRKLDKKTIHGARADRYFVYAEVCAQYDLCLATDFRDVFFQSNPFDQALPVPWGGDDGYQLILAQEFASMRIRDCPYNRKWLESCWGSEWLQKVWNSGIICSGTIMGTSKGFLMLSELMSTELAKSQRKGSSCKARDQGHLNYLYLSGQLNDHNVFVEKQGTGIMNTVGYIPAQNLHTHMNGDHFFINFDGSKSAVVHQYDRHPEFVQFVTEFVDRLILLYSTRLNSHGVKAGNFQQFSRCSGNPQEKCNCLIKDSKESNIFCLRLQTGAVAVTFHPKTDHIANLAQKQGNYLINIQKIFLRESQFSRAGKSLQMLDIGANVGMFSLLAASLGHKVVAFEPFSGNFDRFSMSIIANNFQEHISLHKLALGNEAEKAFIFTEKKSRILQSDGIIVHNISDPIIEKVVQQSKNSEFEKIDVETLDSLYYIDKLKYNDSIYKNVHVVKIDVEGFESLVVSGGMNFFTEIKPKFIFMEMDSKLWETRKMKKGWKSIHDIILFFKKLGYCMRSETKYANDILTECYQNDEILDKNIIFMR